MSETHSTSPSSNGSVPTTASVKTDGHSGHELAASPAADNDRADALRSEFEVLQRSEAALRDFIETATIGLHWVGADGTVLWANQAELDLLGYTREDYFGHHIGEFHADKAVIEEILTYLTRGDTLRDYPARLRHRDGSLRHVLINSSVLFEDGKFVHTRCFTRDVTDTVADEERRREQSRLDAFAADIGKHLIESGNLPDVLRHCTEAMVEHLGAAFARIWALNEPENVLELQASSGLYTHLNGDHGRIPVGSYKIGRIAAERKPHLTNQVMGDLSVPDQEWARAEGLVAFAGYPLIVDDRLLGVMGMFSRRPLSEVTLRAMARVADQISVGIDRKRGETALRESEERFKAIVETTPECVKIIALDGTVLHMNASGLVMVGASCPEAVIGKNVYDLITPEFREAFLDFNQRICSGEKGSLEFDITGLAGQRRHMETHAAPFSGPYGSFVHLGITRDVTERKTADRATKLLGAIVDSSDDAIVSKDLTGTISSWNKSAERVFGYTAQETIGKSVTILIPSDRLQEEPAILARLQKGERVDHFETIRRKKDGTLINVSLTISPVRDSAGNIVGASKIARDITEQKRVEAALQESEGRFRQLADSMPQIVWTARPDGYRDYYNERWYEFTGLPRDVFGDAGFEPVLHPDDAGRWRETWYACVKSGEPYRIEFRLRDRHENRWRWFMGRALPVHDDNGHIVKWFGTCTDIDEQKRVEEELRHANQDLEQFAYSASHDLQEPLRSIKIYGQLLASRHAEKLNGEAREFLSFVTAGASRMELLVRDLLAYTQVTKLPAPEDTADANEILTATLADLAAALTSSGAEVTSDPLPSVCVHATHLKQLFQNLIGNAIKYRSHDRQALVHVSAQQQNRSWIFAVRDNGIGIEPEYKEQIFGLFSRLHTGDEYSGTGIGLAICKRIVERYHGRIWVESEPGQGSTFQFSIPG